MGDRGSSDLQFLLRRLHSLTGVIPIGVFLLFHFFENASARHGAEAFNATVLKISEMPYLYALEWAGLILPILFHAIYGLFIRTPSRPNVVSYSYARNWAYFFQRVSGVIAFVYIMYHVASTRVWALFVKGAPITFADMHTQLQNPLVLALYAVGIVAVTYHFANGLWSFSVTWGIVRSPKVQARLGIACVGFFALLSLVGLDILCAFRFERSFLAFLG